MLGLTFPAGSEITYNEAPWPGVTSPETCVAAGGSPTDTTRRCCFADSPTMWRCYPFALAPVPAPASAPSQFSLFAPTPQAYPQPAYAPITTAMSSTILGMPAPVAVGIALLVFLGIALALPKKATP